MKDKRNGRLIGAAETSKEHAEWRRIQRKNLSILGLQKRKEWPQCRNESSWQVRQNPFSQKKKEQSRQSRASDCEEGESQGEGESHQSQRERAKAGVRSIKDGLHRDKVGFERVEGGQASRAPLEEAGESINR